jgi:hypothetical protein
MVIPLAMLAILAFVVIRSLMEVVAHDDAAAPADAAFAAEADSPVAARANDDARTMLLPAVQEAGADADVAVDRPRPTPTRRRSG